MINLIAFGSTEDSAGLPFTQQLGDFVLTWGVIIVVVLLIGKVLQNKEEKRRR